MRDYTIRHFVCPKCGFTIDTNHYRVGQHFFTTECKKCLSEIFLKKPIDK